MIGTLISSKTRISLLVKFFLNKNNRSYLRGLAAEFDESTNSIRLELNRLEKAGLLKSNKESNKKYYQANTSHPLYTEINKIVLKHTGIDALVSKVINPLGTVDQVYLIGDLANGIDNKRIDVYIKGEMNLKELATLTKKAEKHLRRKVNFEISQKTIKEDIPSLLIWENHGMQG